MTKKMEKKYDHCKVEERIYKMWKDLDAFSPEGAQKLRKKYGLENKKETFCVLMPPPNANAPLHCGHATYSIQDLMIRLRRMQGYRALYLPGVDHAGFETQVVYERELKKKGKSRFDFDRETLFQDILDFVNKNSGIAINQFKKMGMSADWNRNVFMLDEKVIDYVLDTFEKMHKDGLVYRDLYLVNYSPFHGTAFSNLETIHVEAISPLYYVNYRIKKSKDFVTIATVRPETIFADVAVAVNPKDSRYKKLVGKTAINPLNERELPIISDVYVDPDFGTGALKVTPGHDLNDFEIGRRHGLEMISVIDFEGKMMGTGSEVDGMQINKARDKTVEILKKMDAIQKVDEKYTNKLLVDYKDKKPIEPLLMPNWFVKMEALSKKAIKVIKGSDVIFVPNGYKTQILKWLEDIRDWPISRQIVFGIRIPVWYSAKDNPDMQVTFLNKDGKAVEGKLEDLLGRHSFGEIKKGLQKIIVAKDSKYKVSKSSPGKDYLQETDTFDTWFSSGQWPQTTLKITDSEKYYPTSFMDTMWDILFFWVARMIMFGLYLQNDVPFRNVYIHGRIDDEKGKKMSKSKGNVIDPIEYVENYGADALRMGILVGGNTAARTTSFSKDKVRGYRNFSNKLWNMARFMNLMFEKEKKVLDFEKAKEKLTKEDQKILEKLKVVSKSVNSNLEKYRFKDAGEALYQFIWRDIADDYIEHVKGREDKEVALSVLRHVFTTSLLLLHPFMPFITEEVWRHIKKEKEAPLIINQWPS